MGSPRLGVSLPTMPTSPATRPPAAVLARGRAADLGTWLAGAAGDSSGPRQQWGHWLTVAGLGGVLGCVAVGILSGTLSGVWWFLVAGLLLALVTILATARANRRSTLAVRRADLFTDGLLVQQAGGVRAFRTEEAEVYHALGRDRETDAEVYDVMGPDGHTVRLHGQAVPELGALAARFAEQVVVVRADLDRAAFADGEPLAFGPITLASSGLVCANERTSETDTSGAGIGDPAFEETVVAWQDGPRVEEEGVELVITVPPEADVDGFPRRIDRVLVPNPQLLVRLVDDFVRTART